MAGMGMVGMYKLMLIFLQIFYSRFVSFCHTVNHPPLCSTRTIATIRRAVRQILPLALTACIEPIAFRRKVWFSGRIIKNPVPIRRSGLNYEYVNKLQESLRRTAVFYVSTGKP